jgi:hypothetical protein
LADRREGEILLCCSVPRKVEGGNHNGSGGEVILDF